MRLECCQLSFSYSKDTASIIEGLDCVFERPGFHAIFGPSGVGKSSFARLLYRANEHPDSLHLEEIHKILYSYNLERLPGWVAVGTHLERVVPEDKFTLLAKLVDIFELAPLLSSRFQQLSMGQQNRANLIRYLLQDFDLLIMDESLANVDEKLREKIILTIKELFPEKMFLYISHNLMEVSTFCDQIMVFGASKSCKSYQMIVGQNEMTAGDIERDARDRTMLEIMNAF